jgi:hypothetical protein
MKAPTNRKRPFIDSSTIGIREITALAIGDEKAKNAAIRKRIVQNGRRHSTIAANSASAKAATPTYCVAASAKLAPGSGYVAGTRCPANAKGTSEEKLTAGAAITSRSSASRATRSEYGRY